MRTIFGHALSGSRGAIIGWGLGLFALGLLIVPIFDIMVDQQEALLQLVKNYPPELFAFFGGFTEFTTPSGFLGMEYFSYMPIILGIYAVIAGSGLLASDEERGTLDLTMAHPLSRTAFFLGRVAALLTTLTAILLIAWIGVALPSSGSEAFDLTWGEVALPFISLLAILVLFASMALFLSMILPSRRAAAMITGLLLVGSYFINGLSTVNEALEPIAAYLPLKYYQGGAALDGLNLTWLGGLVLAAIVLAVLAWWGFQRRDIRVAGEGSLPMLDRLRRTRRKNQQPTTR
jgi:ABC-2 type transport system permease protein